MIHRDARVKVLEDRRRRCRHLVRKVRELPWETRERCELCCDSEVAVVASSDRYGLPLRAGLCMRCGLVFLLDRLTQDGYASFYQHHYRPLVSSYFGRKIDRDSIQTGQAAYASRLVKSLRPWLKSTDGGTLLDIGGSTGVVAEAFSRELGYRATVLDPAPDELAVARNRGLEVVQGFLEAYDPGPRKFDLILMCQTIDHLLSLQDSLRRVRSLLTEDGCFFVDIVDFDESCFLTGSVESALKADHCYYLSQQTASILLRRLDWHAVNIDLTVQPGLVGYLLRPGDAQNTSSTVDQFTRLRRFQRMQTQWRLAAQHSYGLMHWLRIRAYRTMKSLQAFQQSRSV